MNQIPNPRVPVQVPYFPHNAPNPLPPRTVWHPPAAPTAVGPDGVMRGGNAIPGVSPPGT